jgi:hypothetical protein
MIVEVRARRLLHWAVHPSPAARSNLVDPFEEVENPADPALGQHDLELGCLTNRPLSIRSKRIVCAQ